MVDCTGRPAWNIQSFLTFSPAAPDVPTYEVHMQADKSDIADKAPLIPNPFLAIIQSTIFNASQYHLAKVQRSFVHLASYMVLRQLSTLHKDTELKGAELLDGSMFVCVAMVSRRRSGMWMVSSRVLSM